MNGLEVVLIFVGIPLAFITLVALIILAPGWTRAGSYRPGEPWPYEPIMINGSGGTDVTKALTATSIGELGDAELVTGQSPQATGGASAHW